METLYQIKCSESFAFEVVKIRVIRRGVLPGCSLESITAIDSDGRKFQSSGEGFFSTEEEAWKQVQKELLELIENQRKTIEKASELLREMEKAAIELVWGGKEVEPGCDQAAR